MFRGAGKPVCETTGRDYVPNQQQRTAAAVPLGAEQQHHREGGPIVDWQVKSKVKDAQQLRRMDKIAVIVGVCVSCSELRNFGDIPVRPPLQSIVRAVISILIAFPSVASP